MPQRDRHRERVVNIEFENRETLEHIPYDDRVTIILITDGWASLIRNGEYVTLNSPCVMLISCYDKIELTFGKNLSAISFSFKPVFINSALTFDALKKNEFSAIEDQHDRNAVSMFFTRDEKRGGYIDLTANAYINIHEWMAVIGTETFAQSDGAWTCRIRRYLLQILYMIEDMYTLNVGSKKQKSPVDIAMEYVHINYRNGITLDDICRISGTNKTTLNKSFKEKTGYTAIEYLLKHRLRIACETLAHTNLSIAEISDSVGFKYDTYFIKRFTEKMGMTPTDYRNKMREKRAVGKSE